jgi:hypothetical protein
VTRSPADNAEDQLLSAYGLGSLAYSYFSLWVVSLGIWVNMGSMCVLGSTGGCGI